MACGGGGCRVGSRLGGVTLGFVREMALRPQVWAAALGVPLPYLGARNTGGVEIRQTGAPRAAPGDALRAGQRHRRPAAWPHPGAAQSHSWRRSAPGKQKGGKRGPLYCATHLRRSKRSSWADTSVLRGTQPQTGRSGCVPRGCQQQQQALIQVRCLSPFCAGFSSQSPSISAAEPAPVGPGFRSGQLPFLPLPGARSVQHPVLA